MELVRRAVLFSAVLLTVAAAAAAVAAALAAPPLSPGSTPPAPFPPASALAPAFIWDVDNSSSLPLSRWAPALVAGRAWNAYGNLGLWPRINSDGTLVNCGLPQAGNLTLHLAKLRADLARLLPARAEGACLLDPEFWRAEWNYTGAAYKDASVARAAAALPPGTPAAAVLAAAAREYEAGARSFFEGSLLAVARWFPGCRVGIYAYPQNDWSFGGYVGPRAAAMRRENDALAWLWAASSALFPSIYLTSPGASKYDGQATAAYAGSTVAEAVRCRALVAPPQPQPLVLPMMWYVYDAFPRPVAPAPWVPLTPEDTLAVVAAPGAQGADGLLVWGAVGAAPFAPAPLAAFLEHPLGPALNASFGEAVACARARCSGRGRCMPLGACACVPPAAGPNCGS
jgi:hyaluronoglucosaminidase